MAVILISEYFEPASSDESLYRSVCAETKHPECIQLLQSNPNITNAKNYFDLSGFLLDLAEEKAKEGHKYMKEIYIKFPTQFLNSCANSFYPNTITSFHSAKLELTEDTMTASYDAKVAGDGPQYCVEALTEVKLENPPINQGIEILSMCMFVRHTRKQLYWAIQAAHRARYKRKK
ncbi:unnamed protein product [Lupinus luteus]|uniref:Pectinesterase inhibitor domain-containing protein n=1 Tax=Lupinus luteus TaxID=3873 RepID=A0AAV1YH27_LUPLU